MFKDTSCFGLLLVSHLTVRSKEKTNEQTEEKKKTYKKRTVKVPLVSGVVSHPPIKGRHRRKRPSSTFSHVQNHQHTIDIIGAFFNPDCVSICRGRAV